MHTLIEVQRRLNSLGYDSGPEDGDFGKRSIKALRQFQRENGLEPDGKYGPNSDAALFLPTAKPADGPNRSVLPTASVGGVACRLP